MTTLARDTAAWRPARRGRCWQPGPSNCLTHGPECPGGEPFCRPIGTVCLLFSPHPQQACLHVREDYVGTQLAHLREDR